jgi:AcrR family transcriptional regulator
MKEKSFERKNELIEAALDEFTTKSYENASLNKIIKNAGISKGTFYYHFKDKKALYLFLHESAYKAEMGFQAKRMKELAGDYMQKDFFEKLKLSAQIGVESAVVFPKYTKLTIMFLKEGENEENKEIFEHVNSLRKRTIEAGVEQMVTGAMEAGDLNDRFSKDFIIKIINHFFFHYTEIFGMEEDYEESKFLEDINNFVDFLKFGLGK